MKTPPEDFTLFLQVVSVFIWPERIIILENRFAMSISHIRNKYRFQIYKQDFTLYKNCIKERKERNTQREVENLFSSMRKVNKESFQESICSFPEWMVLMTFN